MDAAKAFESLAASKEFAEFTSLLSNLAGLIMSINSPEGIARKTYSARQERNKICVMLRKDSEGLRRCEKCDAEHYKKAGLLRRPLVYACHAGFIDMAAPIFVDSTHVATLSSGQMIPGTPTEKGFKALRKRLAWLAVDDSTLKKAYMAAPRISKAKAMRIMTLLKLFADHLCASMSKIKELEERLSRDDIRTAKNCIEARFRDSSLCLSDAAASAGLSPAYFSHVFRRETGMRFAKFLQTRRVEEAKLLLGSEKLSVTSVCFSCGFNSLTHFNRVFQAFEGVSPRAWRNASLKRI